ncbi:hypothetical protein EDB85DRAFT_303249 [Lactarius pseudohatsudake]|nr:hypothetical protein EDB85DRAFT_303249 [Lactarius pseudohatsudake]
MAQDVHSSHKGDRGPRIPMTTAARVVEYLDSAVVVTNTINFVISLFHGGESTLLVLLLWCQTFFFPKVDPYGPYPTSGAGIPFRHPRGIGLETGTDAYISADSAFDFDEALRLVLWPSSRNSLPFKLKRTSSWPRGQLIVTSESSSQQNLECIRGSVLSEVYKTYPSIHPRIIKTSIEAPSGLIELQALRTLLHPLKLSPPRPLHAHDLPHTPSTCRFPTGTFAGHCAFHIRVL